MQDPVMNAADPRMGASETQAHLLIHAADEHPGPGNRLEAHWHRLIALCVPKHPCEQGPLLVRIHDMQGHEVAAFEHAGALLDVALPEGTYRVTTQRGAVRRGYTMKLKAGGVFDLHLRLPRQA